MQSWAELMKRRWDLVEKRKHWRNFRCAELSWAEVDTAFHWGDAMMTQKIDDDDDDPYSASPADNLSNDV